MILSAIEPFNINEWIEFVTVAKEKKHGNILLISNSFSKLL